MKYVALIAGIAIGIGCGDVEAREFPAADAEFDEILSLDIADLTITSVSKREEKLSEAPAAVYVLTQEDLHRAGVTSLPEALRMVPGMEVAHITSNSWAVTSRGFNGQLANKLLVMIDGRSIYTPVFSGTYWDDKSTLIENIERIEVIRGPGASLWGSNAVNGIINIITKNAASTQGNYLSAAAGSEENFVEGRRGGKISDADNAFYRAYGEYYRRGKTVDMAGNDNPDDWQRGRGGFRIDSNGGSTDSYTLQGDIYDGTQGTEAQTFNPVAPFTRTNVTNNRSYGGNVLGRWNHVISANSSTSLQAYVDHYSRQEVIAGQHVTTGDVQFQHNLRTSSRNNFIWGAGARAYVEDLQGTFGITFNEEFTTHGQVNIFAQDEYALVPEKLFATVGTKLEYNDYTGMEVQPTARLSWKATTTQTLWTAVSRAVRTPSSIGHDVRLVASMNPGPPPSTVSAIGNSAQDAETLVAYEAGHRIALTRKLSFDTAVFFNDYDRLQTFSRPGAPFVDNGVLFIPAPVSNLGQGYTYGVEEAVNWNVTERWRLTGSYTYLIMDLHVDPEVLLSLDSTEELAPRHQFSARSYWNITDTVQWDNMVYYVDEIASPAESYVRYDTRIGWKVQPGIELSLTGRNLLDSAHPEFPNGAAQAQIERSVLARISWKF